MSFTRIEKELQIILKNKNQPIEYYPQISRQLVSKINEQLSLLVDTVDEEYLIYQKFINKEIDKEQKDELISEALVDSININRSIKEIVLTLQEQVMNMNNIIKSVNIPKEDVIPPELIPELRNYIEAVQTTDFNLVDIKIVGFINSKYNCILKLLILDLTPVKTEAITELIEHTLTEHNKIISNLNYTVIPKKDDNLYNFILNFRLS